jgi:hypothetical protein
LGDEARLIAANITKLLPELNARRSGLFRKRMSLGGDRRRSLRKKKAPAFLPRLSRKKV